jgi:hypothetical protein
MLNVQCFSSIAPVITKLTNDLKVAINNKDFNSPTAVMLTVKGFRIGKKQNFF